MAKTIDNMVDKYGAVILHKLAIGAATTEKMLALDKSLRVDGTEHTKLSAVKSVAFGMGLLSLEEASRISKLMGETAEHFNHQPLAVKLACRNIVDLIRGRIKEKGAENGSN